MIWGPLAQYWPSPPLDQGLHIQMISSMLGHHSLALSRSVRTASSSSVIPSLPEMLCVGTTSTHDSQVAQEESYAVQANERQCGQ